MSQANRRRHPRSAVQGIAAHLQTQEGLSTCVVENISSGGLFIRTGLLLPKGMHVVLNLARPGMRTPLRLTGKITNAITPRAATQQGIHPGMGIELEAMAAADEERFAKLLEQLGAASALELEELPEDAPVLSGTTFESAKLMVQVKGLLIELSGVQAELNQKDRELQRLREENDRLRVALETRADPQR